MITPEIRQRAATPVAFVRHTGPYDTAGLAWQKICSFAVRQGLLGPNANFIGISHDDPKTTHGHRLRYDACVTLDRNIAPSGEIGVQTIPAGRYAVFLHSGAYEKFSETYMAIYREWLPNSGERLQNGLAFELYLNFPDNTPPADLRTEIWVPLES